jgi:hypothetical protein
MKRQRIDKSALAFPVPTRLRCPAHLDWIRSQKCCVPGCSGRTYMALSSVLNGVEAHHLLQGRGGKVRAGDDQTVPLCGGPTGGHHRGPDSPHGHGNEAAWAARHGIDLVALAKWYWANSPANPKGKADV